MPFDPIAPFNSEGQLVSAALGRAAEQAAQAGGGAVAGGHYVQTPWGQLVCAEVPLAPAGEWFVAEITARAGAPGAWVYSFKEKAPDPSGTGQIDLEGGRTGTENAYELNDRELEVGDLVLARPREEQADDYDLYAGIAGGAITVQELDDDTRVTGVTVVKFDQAFGFTVMDNEDGSVTVSMPLAGPTVVGTIGGGVDQTDTGGFKFLKNLILDTPLIPPLIRFRQSDTYGADEIALEVGYNLTGNPYFNFTSTQNGGADVLEFFHSGVSGGTYTAGLGPAASSGAMVGMSYTQATSSGAFYCDGQTGLTATVSGLQFTGGILTGGSLTGTGTVTQVSTQHSLTGGPITSTGTLSLVGDVASPGNSKYYGTDSGGNRGWYSGGTGTVTQVSTQHSLTGGPITGTGTLSLVGDTASPGNSKYYGTDGSGTRGWHDVSTSGRTEDSLSASGTDQASANQITSDAVIVDSADGTAGVILPNTTAGIVVVYNSDPSSNLLVYPPSGAQILARGTNQPYTMSPGNAGAFFRINSTTWALTEIPPLP